MIKKPAARRSVEQLKTAVWPDRASAVRDLKASGVPYRGEDYELAEHKAGSWMLKPLHGSAETLGTKVSMNGNTDREGKVLDLLRKKPGAAPKGQPVVIAHAKAPAKPNGKAPAKGQGGAKGKTPAPPAPPPEPPPGTSESLFRDVMDELAEQPAPEPTPEPVKPRFDLSPVPPKAGPYELILRSADGAFTDLSTIAHAVTVSKKLACKVHVRNGAGEIVRVVDIAAMNAAQRAAGAGRGRPNNSGLPKGIGKSDGAAKLFLRPEGATFKEVQVITEWSITDRFVRRVAAARNCTATKLGDKHWKMVPNKD